MHDLKTKILDEILEHLSESQGSDLKSLLDESRMPKGLETATAEEDPQGLKIESLEVMGKKPNFDDQADDAILASSDKSPSIDPRKAKEIQDSAMESGWQPDKWKKNIKEGLHLSQNDGMGTEDEMSEDEFKELLRRYG